MSRATHRERGRPRHPGGITPAEARVLERLRAGLTNNQIACELRMSVNGVKFHVSNLLSKLACANRHELAAWRGGKIVRYDERGGWDCGEAPRRVRFPDDESLGRVFIRDWGPDARPEPWWEVRHAFGHWEEVGDAHGPIDVPAGSELGLLLDEGRSDHAALAALGPEDIQVLRKSRDDRSRPGLGRIAHWTGLRQLVTGGIEWMTDEDLGPLRGLGRLHHLLLAGTGELSTALAAPPRLRELTLVDLGIATDGGNSWEGSLHVDPSAFRELAMARNLRLLHLINVQAEPDGLRALRGAHGLHELRLTYLRRDDADDAVEPIIELGVPSLSLEGCAHITDRSLERLAATRGARPLAALELQRTQVTDAGLAVLLAQPFTRTLRSLWLGGTCVTGASTPAIGALDHLEELDLRLPEVTDACVAALSGLKFLRRLTLAGTNVGDNCVETLTRMRGLRTLDVDGTRITAAGVAALEAALPDCEVVHGVRAWLVAGARHEHGASGRE